MASVCMYPCRMDAENFAATWRLYAGNTFDASEANEILEIFKDVKYFHGKLTLDEAKKICSDQTTEGLSFILFMKKEEEDEKFALKNYFFFKKDVMVSDFHFGTAEWRRAFNFGPAEWRCDFSGYAGYFCLNEN